MRFFVRSRVFVLGFLVFVGVAVAQTAAIAFFVNDQPVSENVLRRQLRVYSDLIALHGPVAQDIERFALSFAVVKEATYQDTAFVTASSEEVAAEVERFRKAWRVKSDDEEYLKTLEKLGYSEDEYLNEIERELRIGKRINEIKAGITASEAEMKLYYELYSEFFRETGKPFYAFEDVRPSVRHRLATEVSGIKQDAAVEEWESTLMENVVVTFPEGSERTWYDPVVARVDTLDIHLHDLDQAVYGSTYDFDLLTAPNRSNRKDLEVQVRNEIRPQALERLINALVARQYITRSKRAFFGSGAFLVEIIGLDQTRHVRVSDNEVRAFYLTNKSMFSVPTNVARLERAWFKSVQDANAFRWSLLRSRGSDFGALAAKFRGVTTDYGPAEFTNLKEPYKTLLDAKELKRVGEVHISKVIRDDANISVFLLRGFVPAHLPPLETIRPRVSGLTLERAREKMVRAWWAAERKKHTIINNLEAVNKELEDRAKKADAAAGTK